MRITRQQLQEMIEEGVEDALSSAPMRRIVEATQSESDVHVGLEDLVAFGEAYISLGREGRDTLRRLSEGHTPDPMALRSLETELTDAGSGLCEVVLRRVTEARRRTRR